MSHVGRIPQTIPLDYAKPDISQRAPRLGRIAAICNFIGLASYFLIVALQSRFNFSEGMVEGVFPLCLLSIFGIALIVGIVAVARPRSRTWLAWTSVSLSVALWVFLFLVLLG
ncbi:MAG: hypothetical protein ABSB42_00625 [Tepidisphaeraceae bacterium]